LSVGELPQAISAVVEAAFAYGGGEVIAPVAGLAASVVTRYLIGRHERAHRILRSQLRLAGANESDFRDSEQLAAAGVRFFRAAREQAADENLRLLAQAMVGLARRHELWSSEFLKYAEIIAPLSRDELILIGALMTEDLDATARGPNLRTEIWRAVVDKLTREGIFRIAEEVPAVAARAQRSGLIVYMAGFDGGFYQLTPLGRDIRDVVDVDAVIREAPQADG
jgi:hypothetical protein